MSADSILTSKGQTTIPKDIRESLGMKPDDRMTLTMLPDGTVLMRVMLGLDTHVLVRFLVQDDQEQLERAQRLIGRESRRGRQPCDSALPQLTQWIAYRQFREQAEVPIG